MNTIGTQQSPRRIEGMAEARAGGSAPSRSRSLWSDTWSRFRHHRLATGGLAVLALIGLAVAIGPALIRYDPNRIDFAVKNQPPSLAHPMGTDDLGRDQLIRILTGGRISLAVGLAVMLVAITLGVVVGAVAGYVGGAVDNVLMRLVDTVHSLPSLFVLILLVSLVGAGFWPIVLGLGFLQWTTTARLVRGELLSLKRREFVEAARVAGAAAPRILTVHLLPNALGPVIVSATLKIAGAILAESALSFLGLGFQPPNATWGRMLQEAQVPMIQRGEWWRGVFPGAAIFLTVLAVNYVGDGLRDALDPRRTRR